MEHITDKTKIDELTKVNVPKCYEKYINKAIASSIKLLTIKEFVETTEFNINPETFDILFMNINDEGIPIYINSSMLDWMGYKGKSMKQKQLLKELLNRNFDENTDYKILKNLEYKEFFKEENKKIKDTQISIFNSTFPEPAKGPSARSITHLIIMPDAFRSLCMMINTDKGKQIRKYYITLEKLIKAYNLYQTIYRSQEAERAMTCKDDKIDEILLMLANSDEKYKATQVKADEERAKADEERTKANEARTKANEARTKADEERAKSEARFQKLLGVAEDTKTDIQKILPERVRVSKVPTHKNHIFVILKDPDDTEGYPYYAIRRQKSSINSTIQKIKNDYTNIKVILKVEHAGSIHFWNEVKFSHLENNITHTNQNNWFNIKNIEESAFKKAIKNLDIAKLNPKN